MKAVFDTNILIDYLNGIEAAAGELSKYQHPTISIITFMEVLAGVEDGKEEKMVRGFLSSFGVSGLTIQIAEKAILLRRECRLKLPDAIVYATARIGGCMLVTRNSKDFNLEWPDIRLPYEL